MTGMSAPAPQIRCLPALLYAAIAVVCGRDVAADDARKTTHPPRLLTVLIGGIDSDPTPTQIDGTAGRHAGNSGLYRLAGDLGRQRVMTEYFNWNGTRAGKIKEDKPPGAPAIADVIRQHLQQFPGDRVAVVGNSWGGHTALEVARELRRSDAPLAIHLAIFLDASSAGRGPARPKSLPINVNRAVSYFTHNRFVWGSWDAGPRLLNIDLGDPAQHFLIKGGPAYDAPFDVKAHVAAEWDETIHADIGRRLVGLLDGK